MIETFSPNGSFTANTFIDLFGPTGDPDADNPWTGDDRADAIAYDDIEIGTAVQVVFEHINDDITLPRWVRRVQ